MSEDFFGLIKTKDSINITSHAINISVLCKKVGMKLAASNLLDQDVVAAKLRNRNTSFLAT